MRDAADISRQVAQINKILERKRIYNRSYREKSSPLACMLSDTGIGSDCYLLCEWKACPLVDVTRKHLPDTVTLEDAGLGYILRCSNGEYQYYQLDWDFPYLAGIFGWTPCSKCNESDGTVDCSHRTASEMITEAGEFLRDHIGDITIDPI